jgi:hypothetical protein
LGKKIVFVEIGALGEFFVVGKRIEDDVLDSEF